jgi:ribosome-associated toxin RatA of RatAB toxin-antitoxin module
MWLVVAALCIAVAEGAPADGTRASAIELTSPPRIEPLEREGVKGLRASFFVAAPPEHVFATLWDVKRFKDVFPDIHSLEVVRDGGEQLDVKFFVNAVLSDVTYTLRRTRDAKARTISWQSIAGDVRSIHGSWTVRTTADPNISEVVYTSFVDVIAIVPTALVRDTAIKKTNEMAVRVRGACKQPRIADVRTDSAPAP